MRNLEYYCNGALKSSWLGEFSEYPHPETLAWTGHRLSLIADCSDCPTIGSDYECCQCISQALKYTVYNLLLDSNRNTGNGHNYGGRNGSDDDYRDNASYQVKLLNDDDHHHHHHSVSFCPFR